ncbi:PREDICTED: prolactin regulatory element-binding protein-like isoform X2 [Priapulus caudatus]|uniref:Prolactin regulatory element-binding protein-like isoform X2 n=1 Tax=Priapulus caudatus TaxID=37621 RepID=A0ABM1DUS9_PRICU|nr:PREDICTED: prolactin regulatory element-binding protein-like isoform X2 [Priapulus caudatus]
MLPPLEMRKVNQCYVLAAGLEEECQLYSIKPLKEKPDNIGPVRQEAGDGREETADDKKDTTLRHRHVPKDTQPEKLKKTSTAKGEDKSIKDKHSQQSGEATEVERMFEFEKLGCILTDFHADGGFQKAVRFSSDKSLLVTGGADGFLRVWKHPSLEKLYEVKAHSGEIDDLDISPAGDKIVTVLKEGQPKVWQTKDGSAVVDLPWEDQGGIAYRSRNCRFAPVDGSTKACTLFTTHIPKQRSGKHVPCYLTKWNTKTWSVEKLQSTGSEVLSCLAVSDEGKFVAVGTIPGDVIIYIAFSLQRVYRAQATHGIFVTGLDFLPSRKESQAAHARAHDASLLSVSADNQVQIHHVPCRTMISVVWVIIGFVLALLMAYMLLDTVGL